MDIPDTKKKPQRPAYRKPEAVKDLERLANQSARTKYPNMKPEYLAPRKYRDDNANGLTICIVAYVTLKGGFASRISNQGTFNKKLGKYIRGTSRKGLADVMGVYNGVPLNIEVKIGRDKQSEAQIKIQAEVTKAGGLYFIAHNFTDFKQWFDSL
jgi:hypothetical protein